MGPGEPTAHVASGPLRCAAGRHHGYQCYKNDDHSDLAISDLLMPALPVGDDLLDFHLCCIHGEVFDGVKKGRT